MRRTATALIMCAVMVLVALVPLVSGGEYVIIKGPQGPRASAMTWTYEPADYGVWNAVLDNHGLRSIVLDVYDNTSGALEQLLHQRIRFAAYGAYPSGVVVSEPVNMARGHTYEITATPNGPRQSYAVVSDQYMANLSPIAAFNYTVDYLSVSVDASGSYDPDGSITDYVWEWGDSETGSGVTAAHSYAMAGTYTITLTVVDDLGSTGTVSHDVTVMEPPNVPPVASFTVSKLYLDVTVDGSASYDPDGTVVGYAWNWGDGSPDDMSASPMAAHSYAMGGTYTITLTVTDNDGDTGSATQDVTVEPYVDQSPVAMFSYSTDYLMVAFDASLSTDDLGIVSYDWTFGDGMTGSGMMVTHEYSMSGTYTVVLTVADTIGQTDTVMADVTVKANEPPVASFTWTANWLQVSVDASGSYDPDGVIASYSWDFGDGTLASGVMASHTYSVDGTYTITLTVADALGLTDSVVQTLTVMHEPKAPIAMFTVATNYLEISVDGSGSYDSDGTITAYAWDFGDGATAMGATATHTYSMDGTYSVTLTVTDNEGLTGSDSKSVTVAHEPVPPVAAFVYATTWLRVDVDASASYDPDGSIVSYSWSFGDGATATGAMASHTYAMDGTYTITLVTTDNDGLTTSVSQSVTVTHEPIPPMAAFTVNINYLQVSVDASGSSDVDGPIVSYAWDFGDGATAVGVTAVHTYAMDGTYTIALTVTDSDGLTASASKSVTVNHQLIPPVAAFTVSSTYLTVQVDATSSADPDGTIVSFAWTFGDGATAMGMTATHEYAMDGTYLITLLVTDNEGLTGSAEKWVTVSAQPVPPVAVMSATTNWLKVDVDGTGSYDTDGSIVSWAWSFGDGATAMGATATHTYGMDGTYTITLTVTDNDGLTGVDSETVSVVHEPMPPTAAFSFSATYLVVSVDASSSSDPDGTITSYAWAFGDGATATGVTATHEYAMDGTYLITLTVTDNDMLTDTASQSVTVSHQLVTPIAAFTVLANWLQVSVDASGSYDPDGTIESYAWNFGDGATAMGVTATHTYAADGTYGITLTVTDNDGLTATLSKSLTVEHEPIPPVAAFSALATYLVVNVDASASSDADGTIATYAWDFGDGATATGMTATHSYAWDGTYTITLTVTDNDGLTDTETKSVSVVHEPMPPTAAFSASATYLVVSVDASTSGDPDGTIVSYAWDFGDGATATGMTATHEYAMDGTYLIALTVTDNDGLSDSTSMSVKVSHELIAPVASFTTATVWLQVSVDASASYDLDGSVVSYSWAFGDGAVASGVTATHAYAWDGTYSVTLTVTDNDGLTATLSKSVTVAHEPIPPVAAFTASATYLVVSVDASASSDADGSVVSYAWDFGDGAVAAGMTATHAYAWDGTYTITLTVTDNDGLTDTEIKSVTVAHEPRPPTAAFTVSATYLVVSVDASTSSDPDGTIVSYSWAFGDGAIATGMTATHEYAMDGTYLITLTVTDDDDLTGSLSKSVTVEHEPIPPLAAFSVLTTYLMVNVDASSSSDADGTIVSYSWTFGDGAVATGVTATHTYASDGTYTITLTVTDNDGLTASLSKSVTVEHEPIPPVAAFSAVPTYLVVNVDASASSDADGTIASYAWDFGDGGASTGVTASHTYAMDGTYWITLTVTDNDGLADTETKSVTVAHQLIPPTAAFTWSALWEVASFDGSGSDDLDGSITAWAWNFGDTTTGSGMTATHAYGASGSYSVTLTVTDNEGLTGSVSQTVTVTYNNPPVASFTVAKDYLDVTVDASLSTDDFGIASYAWSYGDGGSGTGVMDSHTYAAAGTYTVSLTVVDTGGKSASTSKSVTVVQNTPPTARITLVSTNFLVVSLSGSTSSDDSAIASYAWNFGDSTTGSGVSVTHTYLADGTYTVTLTVTDDHGMTGSATLSVTVAGRDDPPTAAFTYSVTEQTVYVDASGSSDDHGIVSYSWDWGDGTTGTGVTASHTYTLASSMLAFTKSGVGTKAPPVPPYYAAGTTYMGGIPLPNCNLVIADLRTGASMTTMSDATGFYMEDVANGLGGALGFAVGDIISVTATKGTATGTAQSVTLDMGYVAIDVTLTDTGPPPILRTVTLTVADIKGQTDSVSHEVTLEAPKVAPVASFTATPTYLVVQVDGSASSDSDGYIVSWAWDFGDGATATGSTASHAYAWDGTYTITLTVTDNDGLTDTDSKSVTVVHQPRPPTAAYSWSANWEVVSFDASASSDPDGTVTAWNWIFGDSTTGSGRTVTHSYAASGIYSVRLTVTDNEGLTGTITKTVTVLYNNPPVAAFTVTKDYLQILVDASTATDDIGISTYTWSYGDGGSGSGVMDSHTYAAAGTYTVSLTVVDTGGKSATTSQSISVAQNTPPTAVITVVSNVDLTVTLSGAGSADDAPIASYAWSLGDGATDSGVQVTHTYAAAGTYTVSLTITDSGGLTGSAAMDITVSEPIPVPEKTFRLYDMFGPDWGPWWPLRWTYYATDIVLTSGASMNTMFFMPLKVSTVSLQGMVYAPYRFSFDDRNQTSMSINKPEFMPVYGPAVAGAEASIDIRFQYLESTWWDSYWVPTWSLQAGWPGDAWIYRSGADGYDLGIVYDVNMNREAAERWLNMPQGADPTAWWAANSATYIANWKTWVASEGNTRLDIFCGYEWPYDINGGYGLWMTMAVEADGSITLNIGHIALGYEILMTRWFVEAGLCNLETYMEDFTLSASYTADRADVAADFVAQYSMHSVKANKSVDSPAWVWEPAKIDYITKLGHQSDYAPYARIYYTSWNSLDPYLTMKIPYEQTPNWFNLSDNEKLIIEAPTGTVPGFNGVSLTEDDIYNMAVTGDKSLVYAAMNNGTLDLGYTRTGPNEDLDVELSPFWNPATKTLTLEGPMNFDNFRHKSGTSTTPPVQAGNVLYHGAPWIEFNVVSPAAAKSTPGTEITLRGTTGPMPGVVDSVAAVVAISMAAGLLVLVALRKRQIE